MNLLYHVVPSTQFSLCDGDSLKRENKLSKLIKSSKKPVMNQKRIINLTDTTIPKQIERILCSGPSGGKPHIPKIMTEIEKLCSHWSSYAKSQNINPFTIWQTKVNLASKVEQFSKCYSKNNTYSPVQNSRQVLYPG